MGFSYLLSPTAPAPRTRCLGSTVARFARPFESRPVDPVRRECYRQLAETCTAVTTGWLFSHDTSAIGTGPGGALSELSAPFEEGAKKEGP